MVQPLTTKKIWAERRRLHKEAQRLSSSEGLEVVADDDEAWIMSFSSGGAGDWLDIRAQDQDTLAKLQLIVDLVNMAREDEW